MKKKKQEELNVDFIGAVRPLTKKDEQAISEYIKSRKLQKTRKKLTLDDFDVVFDPTPLTEEENRLLNEYIRQDKAKRKKKYLAHQRTVIQSVATSR